MSVANLLKGFATALVVLNNNENSTSLQQGGWGDWSQHQRSETPVDSDCLDDRSIDRGYEQRITWRLGQSASQGRVRCTEDQDLVVVIDNNIMINSTNHINTLLFVGDLTLEWKRQRRNSRIGVLVYSSPVYWRFTIPNTIDISQIELDVMGAVTNARDKGRFTDRGIREAFYNLEAYMKIGQRRNILLITNGESDTYQPTIDVANQAITKGIRMFAIGVGEINYYPFEDELYRIVGRNRNNIIRVEEFKELRDMVDPVMHKLCD